MKKPRPSSGAAGRDHHGGGWMTEVYTDGAPFATATIPAELKSFRSWVVWRYEARDGKLTKVPYVPGEDRRASTTDMRTWRTFSEALAACKTGGYCGLGFVFSSGDPFTGIDLDRCRDPETGEIEPWAQKVIDRAGGYAEASPSGLGVHIIVRGKAPNGRRGRIECYSSERFFTVTGEALR
jgi:putative DNA primase/helicase